MATCVNPLIFKKIFDDALQVKNVDLLIKLLSIIAVLYCMSVVATYIQYRLASAFSANFINQLHLKVFHSMQNIDLEEQESSYKENILSQFTKDIYLLDHTISFTIWIVAQYLCVGVISAALLVYLDWKLTLIVLALLPVVMLLPRYLLRYSAQLTLNKKNLEPKLFVKEKESIFMQDIIKYLRLKSFKRMEYKNLLKEEGRIRFLYNFYMSLASRSISLAISFVTLSTIGIGTFFVITNQMTLGSLVSFVALLSNIATATNFVSSHYPFLLQGSGSLHRIQHLITKDQANKKRYGTETLNTITKGIVFKNVSAGMKGNELLSNLNLEIPAKNSVAIIGPSGAGKSTLLRVLLRDLPISSGTIYVDDINVKHFSSDSLYSKLAVVSQNTKLFSTTIRENIRFGKLFATDEEVIAAAKLAEVHDDIMALTKGYDTQVDEGNLSGGQIQRIAVARALISKPEILCLDEAVSALDTLTAAALESTFKRMSKIVTIISVTHHLQAAATMDKIYVIHKGKIAEAGTHAELLKLKKLYYKMWQQQNETV